MYQTLPVNVVGGSYQHRSLPLSAQVTRNLYVEVVESGRSPTSMHAWPGAKGFSNGDPLEMDRGMHVMNDTLYKVSGTSLYSVDENGTQTFIGIIKGSNRCIFDDDGTNLIITTGTTAYQYNGTSLSQFSDVDFEPGNSVAFLNSQMIFDGSGGRFQVSDPGDPDSILSLNFATAESAPDDTIRVHVFADRLLLFGDTSIENWYNSGVGNPPFDKITNATINVGLGALHSVASTLSYTYFLANDNSVYRISSFQAENVTPAPISHKLSSASVSDAIGFTVNLEGQYFYILTLHSADKTFCFSENNNQWIELSAGTSGGRHFANSYAYVYGKHLIADHRNGNIYEWDIDTYLDNSAEIIRERVIEPISAIALNLNGSRLVMRRFELIMHTGTGTASGQGTNPKVMFQASYDGGRSWTNEVWVAIVRAGEGMVKVEWYNMASFYDVIIRFKFSDPIFTSIHSAAIDVKLGGW